MSENEDDAELTLALANLAIKAPQTELKPTTPPAAVKVQKYIPPYLRHKTIQSEIQVPGKPSEAPILTSSSLKISNIQKNTNMRATLKDFTDAPQFKIRWTNAGQVLVTFSDANTAQQAMQVCLDCSLDVEEFLVDEKESPTKTPTQGHVPRRPQPVAQRLISHHLGIKIPKPPATTVCNRNPKTFT